MKLLFEQGIAFHPERVTIITIPGEDKRRNSVVFAIIVHGVRRDTPSSEAVQLITTFDTQVSGDIDTVGIRLLSEIQDKSTWLQINK